MLKKRLSFLLLIVLCLSLILSGCEDKHEYAKKAEKALESPFGLMDAMDILDEWTEKYPDVERRGDYQNVYKEIVARCKELNIEPESGYEFDRSINYQGGCQLIVSSGDFPAIVNVFSQDREITVDFYVRAGEKASIFLPPEVYTVYYTKGDVYTPNGFWHSEKKYSLEQIELEQYNDGSWTSFTVAEKQLG